MKQRKSTTKTAPFSFTRPKDSPGFLLWQATMNWQRRIKRALEPHDISHAQFVILALLAWLSQSYTNVTQVLLVDYSKLDKMTVSKSLKKLVSLQLVQRHEHKADTRAKTVLLTDKGKHLVRQIVPIVENIDATFFENATKADQKMLMKLLHILAAHD